MLNSAQNWTNGFDLKIAKVGAGLGLSLRFCFEHDLE